MYINTILRTGKNRNKVKETKKNEQHFTFQDFMQTLKKTQLCYPTTWNVSN